MKKKVLLAVILSMLAVASTGCALVEDITDAFDSLSSSSSDTRDEDEEEDEEEDKDEENRDIDEDKDEDKDSDKKTSLSDILNFNKNNSDEEPREEVIVEPATSIVEATEVTDATENASSEQKDKLLPSGKQLLYDDAGLKITYSDFEKEYSLLRFNMTFENSCDIPLVVQAWEVYINGIEVDAIMSVETKTDDTIEDAMKFYIDDLEELGIGMDDIETVEVSFHIFDWDSRVDSLDTELIKFTA